MYRYISSTEFILYKTVRARNDDTIQKSRIDSISSMRARAWHLIKVILL